MKKYSLIILMCSILGLTACVENNQAAEEPMEQEEITEVDEEEVNTERAIPGYEMFDVDLSPESIQEQKDFEDENYVYWSRDEDDRTLVLRLSNDGSFTMGIPHSGAGYFYLYKTTNNINKFEITDLDEDVIENHDNEISEYVYLEDIADVLYPKFVYLQDKDIIQLKVDGKILDYELFDGEMIYEENNPYND